MTDPYLLREQIDADRLDAAAADLAAYHESLHDHLPYCYGCGRETATLDRNHMCPDCGAEVDDNGNCA